MDKPCSQCGQLMQNRTARARFCSVACKETSRTEARRAAVLADRADRTCVICGRLLERSKKANAQTCSKSCAWRYQNRLRAAAQKEARWAKVLPCRVCGGEIPRSRTARGVYCSDACRTIAQKPYRNDYNRRYLYGVTPEEYAALIERQGGRCAICKTDTPNGKGWHIDHDHATGNIRGILCHRCNLAIGHFKDNPARLEAALAYLR